MEELKLCPFCGGEAKIVKTRHINSGETNPQYFVECMNDSCFVTFGMITGDLEEIGLFDSALEAIEAWNKRV